MWAPTPGPGPWSPHLSQLMALAGGHQQDVVNLILDAEGCCEVGSSSGQSTGSCRGAAAHVSRRQASMGLRSGSSPESRWLWGAEQDRMVIGALGTVRMRLLSLGMPLSVCTFPFCERASYPFPFS